MKKFIFIAVFLIACMPFAFCNGISDYMERDVGDGYRVTFSYNGKENMILVRNNKVLLTVNSEEEREAVLQMMAEEWFTESIDNTSDKAKAVSIYNALYDNYFSVNGDASFIKEGAVVGNVRNEAKKGLINDGKVFQVGTPGECDINKYEEVPQAEEPAESAAETPISEEMVEEVIEESEEISIPTEETIVESEVEEAVEEEAIEYIEETETEEPAVPASSVTEVKFDSYVFELLAKALENGINVNITSAEPAQKERKDYKNHVSLNASMQLYNVKYFKNVIPLSPTESTFNSDVSSFFGMSYRYSINKNTDIGLSTGISITAHSNEMFLNSPITLDWRYNFSKVFAAVRAGAVLTYNENSASLIPSMGAEIGCAFDEGDVSLEVSCGILSGYWMSGTSSSKSYILTEFLPIKISIVRNF